MNLQHVNVKVFLDGPLQVDHERFIEVFHEWVAQQSLPGLSIDVADYRHVPNGPSVMLIGLESDYAIDEAGGRCGLRYNRKGVLEGSNADRFRQALEAAGEMCRRLEERFDGLRFSRNEFEVLINDRGLAPNTEATRTAFQDELSAFLQSSFGAHELDMTGSADERRLVGGVVRLEDSEKLAAVLQG